MLKVGRGDVLDFLDSSEEHHHEKETCWPNCSPKASSGGPVIQVMRGARLSSACLDLAWQGVAPTEPDQDSVSEGPIQNVCQNRGNLNHGDFPG